MKNQQGFIAPALITMILLLCFYAFLTWIAGSVITSGVKAVSNNCGKTYPIEKLVEGDWFCVK